jgi:hypothetical protein
MRRRELITLVGGTAAWPMAARAQQRERMRRVGVLLGAAADDPQFQPWVGAFLQELALLGPMAVCRYGPLGSLSRPKASASSSATLTLVSRLVAARCHVCASRRRDLRSSSEVAFAAARRHSSMYCRYSRHEAIAASIEKQCTFGSNNDKAGLRFR